MNEQEQHHSHDHGHDHGHSHSHGAGGDPFHPQLGGPLDPNELDPANRSLAEALRLSFGILTFIMAGLVVLYLFSGVYTVAENEVAVVMRFGKLRAGVVEPGVGVALPRPIDKVLRIPTSLGQVNIDKAFWFEVAPGDRNKTLDQFGPKPQLQPGKDGSLITGDRNIVHGKWSIGYQITKDDAESFVRNVSADSDPREMTRRAEERVRHAAERAIVHVIATIPAERFIRGEEVSPEIKARTQEKLNELDSGITIMTVATSQAIPPLSVRREFDAVTIAFSEQARKQEDAKKGAEQTLSDTAGPAHKALAIVIDRPETARRDEDADAADKSLKAINALLEGTPAGEALAPLEGDERMDADRLAGIDPLVTVGGEVSKRLSEARSFRRTAQEEVRAEARRFSTLLAQYQDPGARQTYMARQWYEVMAQIFATDVTVDVRPPGHHLYLEVNKDPRWARYLEEKKFRAEQEEEKRRRDLSQAGGS